METLLLVGRWNAITRDQENTLRRTLQDYAPARTFFVITGADQSQTRRYPLTPDERQELVKSFATKHCRYHEIFRVTDVADPSTWVAHVQDSIVKASQGRTRIDPGDTTLVSGNLEVVKAFEDALYTAIFQEILGSAPSDVAGAILACRSWRAIANDATTRLYEAKGIEARVRKIYSDIELTEDGELSHNREFVVYVRGMDASLKQKVEDIFPHLRPGLIVDKGCGSGSMLIELSLKYPTSRIYGMELSRELLRLADGRHYPNQNVTIVKGNVAQPHFPPGTVDTAIFSSVMHEIYSYARYSRDAVRLALGNTRMELKRGGVVIIRDGVKPPPRRMWMRCDGTTEARFRRFAKEFKETGFKFEEREYLKRLFFVLGSHEINEFLTKKDYLENWSAEVREEFGVWTLEEWKKELEAVGFKPLVARSYLNPWIVENRYKNRAWLYADAVDVPGDELPYPDTNLVLVAEG
ncbi:MAG: methyltransferase domain-containing protein [Planctomycetes bacterium]|nr:methyltransferase domain-containing protein [Planctomycetota bacterium]